jgi:hypothetical protein
MAWNFASVGVAAGTGCGDWAMSDAAQINAAMRGWTLRAGIGSCSC